MDLVERIKEKLAGHITPRGFDELIGAELKEVAQLEVRIDALERTAADAIDRYVEESEENERLREYVQHEPECWKNQALRGLGVGGTLASCTCGLVEALGGDK